MNRGRPLEFDRSHALEAAMEKFWESGYEGTGLTDLETCTGLGRQSLYNAFGDKRALFRQALRHYLASYIEPILTQLRAPRSPLANIEAVLDLWERRASGPDKRGCFLSNSLAELGLKDPQISPELSHALKRLEKGFADALREAQRRGELSKAHDPKALARLLTTIGQGLSIVHRVKTPAFSRDAIRAVRTLLST